MDGSRERAYLSMTVATKLKAKAGEAQVANWMRFPFLYRQNESPDKSVFRILPLRKKEHRTYALGRR